MDEVDDSGTKIVYRLCRNIRRNIRMVNIMLSFYFSCQTEVIVNQMLIGSKGMREFIGVWSKEHL